MIDELLERMGQEYAALQIFAKTNGVYVPGTFYEFVAIVMDGCDRYGNLVERRRALRKKSPPLWRFGSAWQRLDACFKMRHGPTSYVLAALARRERYA